MPQKVLLDSYSGTIDGNYNMPADAVWPAYYSAHGQTMQTPVSGQFYLSEVRFKASKLYLAAINQQVVCRIYNLTSNDPNALPSGTIPIAQSAPIIVRDLAYVGQPPREDDWIVFQFDETLLLEKTKWYGVAIVTIGAGSSGQYLCFAYDQGGTHAGRHFDWSGISWSGNSNYDHPFKWFGRKQKTLILKSVPQGSGVPILVDGQNKDTYYEENYHPNSTINIEMPLLHTNLEPIDVGPSNVTEISGSYGIRREGEKGFYAAGRFWQFWVTTGAQFYYSTSIDGINWTSPIFVRNTNYQYGNSGQVWFDGTYVHITIKEGLYIYIRIGTPLADGTIQWKAAWQVGWYAGAVGTLADHNYAVSTSGIPYITWIYGDAIDNLKVRVTRCNHDITVDGLWTTQTGFPLQIAQSGYYYENERTQLITYQPNGNMLVIGVKNEEPVKMWRCVGDSWYKRYVISNHGVEQQYDSGQENWCSSLITDLDGNIHLAWLASDLKVYHRIYYSSTGEWSNEEMVANVNNREADPSLTLDPSTGDVYCFMAHYPSTNHLGYKRWSRKNKVWALAVDWIDETATGFPSRPSSHVGGNVNTWRRAWSGYIGVTYIVNKPGGNYYVKFKALNLNITRHYRWLRWDDGPTSNTRQIILSEDTILQGDFERFVYATERLLLYPWYKAVCTQPGGGFEDTLTFEAKKSLFLLLILQDIIMKTPILFLLEALHLSDIRWLVFPIIYKCTAYLTFGMTFVNTLLKRFKAYMQEVMEED